MNLHQCDKHCSKKRKTTIDLACTVFRVFSLAHVPLLIFRGEELVTCTSVSGGKFRKWRKRKKKKSLNLRNNSVYLKLMILVTATVFQIILVANLAVL